MSELDFVLETAARVHAADIPSMHHLASPLSVRDYIRIADGVARATRGTRVLDWGCGYGHVSYLLANRGLDVTAYDVGPVVEDGRLFPSDGVRAVRGSHLHGLPFRSGAFDAVLACGVLEHVADMERSLDELSRVLVPNGQLFVFNLPQRWSYKELAIKRLHLGYTHERKFTESSIRTILEGRGFRVRAVQRAGFVPHLATGLSPRARRFYYRAASSLFTVDRVLGRAPVLNKIAQSLELVAERRGECE